MAFSRTLTKTQIVHAAALANGFIHKKSVEIVEILLKSTG